MEKLYVYLKSNFFKIFFFSLFLTVVSFFYEHYGWVKNKAPETIQIALFSTVEENSVLCGGLPLPYAFEFHDVADRIKGQPLFFPDAIIYKSIFFIDILLWMFILTLLSSWLKEVKSKKISKKENGK